MKMRRVIRTAWVCLGAGLVISCKSSDPTPPKIVVKPNELSSSWESARTTLPREFVDTTKFLLGHGLGDPRGGEYRHFRIELFNPWNLSTSPVEASGWVFPASDRKPFHAVCLNGLSYELNEAGTAADLSKDLALADLKSNILDDRASPAVSSKSHLTDIRSDSAIALLLILGHTASAEKLFAYQRSDVDRREFMKLSASFLATWWDRAVSAHINGNNQQAFHDSVLIKKFRPDYEREARRILGEGWVQQMSQPQMGGEGIFQAFPFLNGVEQLVDDEARRIANGPKPPVDWVSFSQKPQVVRISILIEALENCRSFQAGKPGSLAEFDDLVFKALVKEGRAAIVPLLDVMDNDTRLTRAVQLRPEYPALRELVSVKDAARIAIGHIVRWLNIDNINGTAATSQQIREFLVTNGGGSDAVRYFNVLGDDRSTPEQWLEATRRLTEPATDPSSGTDLPIGQARPMRAEELRSRVNPSLSELLKKRVDEIVDNAPHDSTGLASVSIALQIAILEARWDTLTALPSLAKTSNALMTPHDGTDTETDRLLSQAIELRLHFGDRTALYEYSQWLLSMKEKGLESTSPRVLQTLVNHASTSDLKELPEMLFLAPDSAMNLQRLASESPNLERAQKLALSPLLKLPAMQKAVHAALNDKSSLGSVVVDNSSKYTIVLSSSTVMRGVHSDRLKTDPLSPKPGEHRDYRVCDSMAVALRQLKGAPNFEPYWPDTAKDTAIRSLSAFIERNADHVIDLIPAHENWKDSNGGSQTGPASGVLIR